MKPWLVIALAAGCTQGGVSSDPVGVDNDNGSGNGGDNGSGTNTATEPPPPTYSINTSGNCGLADGPVHPAASVNDVDQLIVGQWIRCSGKPFDDSGNDGYGLELAADGTYYDLADDGSGGVVQLHGFGNQGTWTAQLDSTTVFVFVTATGGDFNSAAPTFEDSPSKFAVLVEYEETPTIYAALH